MFFSPRVARIGVDAVRTSGECRGGGGEAAASTAGVSSAGAVGEHSARCRIFENHPRRNSTSARTHRVEYWRPSDGARESHRRNQGEAMGDRAGGGGTN